MSPSRLIWEMLPRRTGILAGRGGWESVGTGDRTKSFSLLWNAARCSRTMATSNEKRQTCLTMDNLNPNIKLMEYAVRGPLVIRASAIEKELQEVRNLQSGLAFCSWQRPHHYWLSVANLNLTMSVINKRSGEGFRPIPCVWQLLFLLSVVVYDENMRKIETVFVT